MSLSIRQIIQLADPAIIASNCSCMPEKFAWEFAAECASLNAVEPFRIALASWPKKSRPADAKSIADLLCASLDRRNHAFAVYILEELVPSLPPRTQKALANQYADCVLGAVHYQPADEPAARKFLAASNPKALGKTLESVARMNVFRPALLALAAEYASLASLEAAMAGAVLKKRLQNQDALRKPLMRAREIDALQKSSAIPPANPPKPRL